MTQCIQGEIQPPVPHAHLNKQELYLELYRSHYAVPEQGVGHPLGLELPTLEVVAIGSTESQTHSSEHFPQLMTQLTYQTW